jgi:hypothetical protein
VKCAKQLAQAEKVWAKLGKLIVQIEQDKDFLVLGFENITACMESIAEAADYSRASIFRFKQLYSDCSRNGDDQVLGMRLKSAEIYRQLPEDLQKDPEILEAVKTLEPKKFREKLASEHPSAHFETRETVELDSSLIFLLDQCVEAMKKLYSRPELNRAAAIEITIADWCTARYDGPDTPRCSVCGAPETNISNMDKANGE